MAKRSAGLLMFRRRGGALEVFLAHPGGPFWKNKDAGAWSIPKGEYAAGADPLEEALREFEEEIGMKPAGKFIALGEIKQRGGKMVAAWAVEGDCEPEGARSNTFTMEWPSKSGKMQTFPEVDRAGWFSIDEARTKLLTGQTEFLDRLLQLQR